MHQKAYEVIIDVRRVSFRNRKQYRRLVEVPRVRFEHRKASR